MAGELKERYRYLGNTLPFRITGEVYDADHRREQGCLSVKELAQDFPEDWELIQEKSQQELLLEEAKLRYPIGTEFYSALPGDLNPTRLKCNGEYRFQKDVHGYKNVIWNKDHNNRGCGFLYCNGTWAEIINKNTMCTEKTIKLSLDQAKKMYGKSPEMDELLLANFSKEELTKKELPKGFSDLKITPGYYITSQAKIDMSPGTGRFINTFATEKQARSALSMAQLSQLMAVYNDGWEFIPNCLEESRGHVITRSGNQITTGNSLVEWSFLAFKSAEIRDEFLKNFKPLIKEYFMID